MKILLSVILVLTIVCLSSQNSLSRPVKKSIESRLKSIESSPEVKELQIFLDEKLEMILQNLTIYQNETNRKISPKGFLSSISGGLLGNVLKPAISGITQQFQPIFKPIVNPIINKLPGGFFGNLMRDCLNDVTLCAASYYIGQTFGPGTANYFSNIYANGK